MRVLTLDDPFSGRVFGRANAPLIDRTANTVFQRIANKPTLVVLRRLNVS